MLRFLTAFLFLAVAMVLSITAGDVFAAGKSEAVALAHRLPTVIQRIRGN